MHMHIGKALPYMCTHIQNKSSIYVHAYMEAPSIHTEALFHICVHIYGRTHIWKHFQYMHARIQNPFVYVCAYMKEPSKYVHAYT